MVVSLVARLAECWAALMEATLVVGMVVSTVVMSDGRKVVLTAARWASYWAVSWVAWTVAAWVSGRDASTVACLAASMAVMSVFGKVRV